MVYIVQAYLLFRNAARRDAIVSNIETRLANTVPFNATARYDIDDPGPGSTVVVVFQTEAEADSFWADALAMVGTGVNGPVAQSGMWRHPCNRDDPDRQAMCECVFSDQRAW